MNSFCRFLASMAESIFCISVSGVFLPSPESCLMNFQSSASLPKKSMNEWLGSWLEMNVVWNPASLNAWMMPFSR